MRDPRIDPIAGDVVTRKGVTCAVTHVDRDELRKAIWDVIREDTRCWTDRDRELHDVLLGMACEVRCELDETTNAE